LLPPSSSSTRAGILCSVSAFTCWGLLPLYLRLVGSVGAAEILTHRIIWSVVFVLGVLAVTRRWGWVRVVRRSRAVLGGFVASAACLSANWLLFVWAVNSGHSVDASLGYFINPIVSVALGALVLRERLSPARRLSLAVASAGVLWLTVQLGQVPWIGLGLAASFGAYGLLRKTATLGALEGLAVETLLLSPVACAYLGWLVAHGQSRFVTGGARLEVLLLAAGPITAVPLLLFAAGARRIPLSLVGILQYIGPTLQLLVGVAVFGEPFGRTKLVGYALIWLAFALATVESFARAVQPSSANAD
jgi:chloramphenicol-sensitive protein RarD